VTLLTENESTYIPIGMNHRLENPGKLPLHLIEVQSGSYLGEDDIVRFEDVYQRSCISPPPTPYVTVPADVFHNCI
jgi:mannose-1-phosphate guanylyltransferase/mannose-6-phosphate isomerase